MVKNTKKFKQTLISVLIVAAVAVATVFIFRAINQKENQNSSTPAATTTSTETSPAATAEDAASTTESTADRHHEADKDFFDEYDSNSGPTITGVRSYTALQEDGSVLMNFALDQYLGSGTCDLTFGAATATAALETSAATSFCSLRLTGSFAAGATYTYTLQVSSEQKSGTLTGEATL